MSGATNEPVIVETVVTFTTDVARGREAGDPDDRIEIHIPRQVLDETRRHAVSTPHPDGNRALRRRAASMARRRA